MCNEELHTTKAFGSVCVDQIIVGFLQIIVDQIIQKKKLDFYLGSRAVIGHAVMPVE